MKPLCIVYATDDGYLMPTMVAAASALSWAGDVSSVQIHILDTGIADDGWDNFEKSLRIHFGQTFGLKRHKIERALFSGFKTWHGSVGTYARLLIPDLIPDADWCVYCDGDTLFTDDPLKLRQIFDSNFAIQGHADWQIPEMNRSRKEWFERNGLGWVPDQYVCAGFLLMNLDWFRKNDGAKRCLDFIRQYSDVVHPDQDALAYVCRGHVGILPDEWGRFSWDAFRNGRPGCLHYASDLPWKLMTNKYRDYNDAHKLWFEYGKALLGLEMGDILGSNFDSCVMIRKRLWRIVFQSFSILMRMIPVLRRTSMGNYCTRHYSSWRIKESVKIGR